MRRFLSMLPLLFASAVLMPPSLAYAQISIGASITIAPPPLVVYPQPPIPAPGYFWTPGYWAWGPDGYYWRRGRKLQRAGRDTNSATCHIARNRQVAVVGDVDAAVSVVNIAGLRQIGVEHHVAHVRHLTDVGDRPAQRSFRSLIRESRTT
jgi:WXXGXW repeat (2 copies)